jgi:predicted naringenin-chalcone synthase
VSGPHITGVGTAGPRHDIHAPFLELAKSQLPAGTPRTLFARMAERSGIAHRFSILAAGNLAAGEVDADGFYQRGRFPGTAARMALYERHAAALAQQAVEALGIDAELDRITHLVVASCTGFMAPGLDLRLADLLGLRRDVARTMIGFMGCSAAVPALRCAAQAVRADPASRVLVVTLELCTLHLQETQDLETALSFLLFADGCAAALVTADAAGLALDDFHAAIIPDSHGLITWHIGDQGFRMHLSGQVPARILRALREEQGRNDAGGILRGGDAREIAHWAVHAGGRTVLDAVELGLSLAPAALRHSRAVLRDYGNMSSATILFVLARILREAAAPARGLAMAFGPGMVAETFRFRTV